MFGTVKGRLLLIIAALVVSVAILFTKGITRGLDLSGGVYMALEVQDSAGTMTAEVKREHTLQALEILRNRLDQFGVVEPNIQGLGDSRIIVELPGLADMDRARAVIALNLTWMSQPSSRVLAST